MTSLPRHGGDLAFARSRYGNPPDGWLDLSTGINPDGYRTAPIAVDSLARLPDRGDLERLLETARSAYSVAGRASLLAVPGSEIAIRLLPLILTQGRVAILSPTYGSHAEAWRQAGRSPAEIGDLADLPDDVAVVVVGNPNNPDGRMTEPEDLIRLAQRLAKRAGLLIVDEAFADLTPSKSLAPHLDKAPAVILRSFGKFFGLAGLRLGFVAGPAPVLARLERLLGDWPVSAAAIAIGEAALADRAWQEKARDRLSRDAGELLACLGGHRLAIRGGTDLFALVEDSRAADLHRGLAERGIWTRSFHERPDWLRLGLPPTAAALARLDRALAEILKASGEETG